MLFEAVWPAKSSLWAVTSVWRANGPPVRIVRDARAGQRDRQVRTAQVGDVPRGWREVWRPVGLREEERESTLMPWVSGWGGGHDEEVS